MTREERLRRREVARTHYLELGANDIAGGIGEWREALSKFGNVFTDRERYQMQSLVNTLERDLDDLEGLIVELELNGRRDIRGE